MNSNYSLDKKSISKQSELQIDLNNIKSSHILKIIFDNLNQKIALEIIQYNKKLQNRLNISINDYKKFYEIVEIEIVPADNKYGSFINILNQEEKSCHHIFFNDSREEIQRAYITKKDKVTSIKVVIDNPLK